MKKIFNILIEERMLYMEKFFLDMKDVFKGMIKVATSFHILNLRYFLQYDGRVLKFICIFKILLYLMLLQSYI